MAGCKMPHDITELVASGICGKFLMQTPDRSIKLPHLLIKLSRW